MQPSTHRKNLIHIYKMAVNYVDGKNCVERYLTKHPLTQTPLHIIAIGKAAHAMAEGAINQLKKQLINGLIITAAPPQKTLPNFTYIKSDHPIPSANSLKAGKALLKFIQTTPKQHQLLFLISGGSSSLVEVLQPNISLTQLKQLNQWLLSEGLPIEQMNVIRAACSCIKGGGLLHYLAPSQQITQLLISDIPSNQAEYIGSGLLFPYKQKPQLNSKMPPWLINYLSNLPWKKATKITKVKTKVIATIQDALHAAKQKAIQLGYTTHLENKIVTGDAEKIGKKIIKKIQRQSENALWIFGGETSVTLPKNPGIGGRNQQLALSAALAIQQADNQIYLLSAGSDGVDGVTTDAGAIIDNQTIQRGKKKDYDPLKCLADADANTFLKASDDLIHTGPSNTNVMDIILALSIFM